MKVSVHALVVGCALGALALAPALAPGFALRAEASPALALVSGTVKDDGGRPLPGAVVALLESAFNGREIKSVKTDAEGRFTAEILPGSYRMRAAAAGFRPVLARVLLERASKLNYDFALKRVDTLVDQRGDRADYRWIGRSVPRHVLHLDETGPSDASAARQVDVVEDRFTEYRPSFHGMLQLVGTSSAYSGPGAPNFFGTNFAVSGSLGNGVEMAIVGQRGRGAMSPQRLEAITTFRPTYNHQVTASVGYGSIAFGAPARQGLPEPESGLIPESAAPVDAVSAPGATGQPAASSHRIRHLEQLSISAVAQWQVFQPLLVIYGFDYARFVGSAARQRDSILPRLAFQYSPNARWRVNAAATPGAAVARQSPESFDSENLQTTFETQTPEFALAADPQLDRSRRFEFGVEKIFEDGAASLEASAFYDLISGHGVGVLALPLEASPETQAAFARVAGVTNHSAGMQGAARGVRVMYARRFGDYITASAGYSLGRGSRLNDASLDDLTPARLFRNDYFQVATARLDLDFSERTGTRISTVVRLSPDAVVFAIDPFAGRMSVYDPNINIYVTQDLPSLGLPVKWQAIVDIRNLLNQIGGVEDDTLKLVAARNFRSVRTGLAFRW
ncbi:MAG: carboxypeptidase regulatory-like domain-containing protein [Acidobacteria bacterium]|nr:carboxypeptidase regulatory-like domain-containing protein [Acidobacteriota bacterium]MCW5969525.1 carboxypeptidase regulatory-like domain-containing protein [Blastocatellales bacterium]